MSTVAVYGGSFNPPHSGHAMVAAWLSWCGVVDEVWLVPSNSHPFGKALAPFERRLDLCDALAEAVGPWVRTCALEAELSPPNYTVDLLGALQLRHPEHTFRLVIGADVVPDLPRWHRWSNIEQAFAPIVVGRQGYPTPTGAIDFPGISSTEVRRLIGAGESVDHLVPKAVRKRLGMLYTTPLR